MANACYNVTAALPCYYDRGCQTDKIMSSAISVSVPERNVEVIPCFTFFPLVREGTCSELGVTATGRRVGEGLVGVHRRNKLEEGHQDLLG